MSQLGTPLGVIGNTPLVELKSFSPKPGVRILAKLEGQNPTGSIKDRVALGIVEAAERRGALTPGATLVEASSGNTAISLALVARQKGYRLRVVLPEGVTPSIVDTLEILGHVEVELVASRAGMVGAIEVAEARASQPDSYAVHQFSDPINPEIHYAQTGREIAVALVDAGLSPDAFIAGIGTGGTLMGVGRRLRELNPKMRVIGVEPDAGERLQGLRSIEEGATAPLLDLESLDGRYLVNAAKSIVATERVARQEGLLVGISSGACLHAALRVAQKMDTGVIVVMFADGGWKYLPAHPWKAAQEGDRDLDEVYWW